MKIPYQGNENGFDVLIILSSLLVIPRFLLYPISAVKVLKNRIVLIMRVNPDVQIVSMVSVNH
jgi:hypothetical protein